MASARILPDAVTFDFNSASLTSQFRPALDGVAATLAEYPQSVVEISGHTDVVGHDEERKGIGYRLLRNTACDDA